MADKIKRIFGNKNNAIVDSVTQDGGKTSTALHEGSADATAMDDSTSKIYVEGSLALEEISQRIRNMVGYFENSARFKNKTIVDYTSVLSYDKKIEQTADLQKEVIQMKAELATKNEKIRSLEAMLDESKKTEIWASCEDLRDNTLEALELQEQMIRLKTLLSASSEKPATLKTMLKSNEDNDIIECNYLKSKYEDDNAEEDETVLILKKHLGALKEFTASFSSLHAMFVTKFGGRAAREDELQLQLDEFHEISDKFNRTSMNRMNEVIENVAQDGEEATAALQKGSADSTAVEFEGSSLEEVDGTASQTCSKEETNFEELMQSIRTSVADLESSTKSEKIDETTTNECQAENAENTGDRLIALISKVSTESSLLEERITLCSKRIDYEESRLESIRERVYTLKKKLFFVAM